MLHEPLTPDSATGRLIQRLGYAGLIPFVLCALLMWLVTPEVHPLVAIALVRSDIVPGELMKALERGEAVAGVVNPGRGY